MPKTLSALACLALLNLSLPAAALDADKISSEIHRLTNAMRAEKNLPPLAKMPELDSLARRHSQNMASQHFFDHVDPAGLSPGGRMQKYLPGLLTTLSAENIAMRTVGGDNEASLAFKLIEQWRHSPGHYANIMTPGLEQLGAGIAVSASHEIYATQNFATALVMLEQKMPAQVPSGKPLPLKFRYLGSFPKEQLTVFVHVPDRSARFPVAGGSFYTGGGPLQPSWSDSRHFSLNVPTRFGLGEYSLGIGRSGSYYNTPFRFQAVAASGTRRHSGAFAFGACQGLNPAA